MTPMTEQTEKKSHKAAPTAGEYSIPDVPYLSTTEAAKIAGVTRATAINWCRAYDGLATRVGYHFRVHPEGLRLLLEGKLPKKSQQTDHDQDQRELF